MAITPKRRRKLNKEQHQLQRHKEIKHNSDAMLLGQSGGDLVSASSVEILPEGSGYYTIKVEVSPVIKSPAKKSSSSKAPAADGTSAAAAAAAAATSAAQSAEAAAAKGDNIIYCNSIIEISLECKGKYISYDNGSKIVCDISPGNSASMGSSMGICAITSDGNTVSIPLPLDDNSPQPPNTVSTNDLSVDGEPINVKIGTNYWSFKFDINDILNRQSGPIYDLIQNATSGNEVVSKFVSFNNTSPIILTFKNVRIIADTIPKDAINIIFKVKNDGNIVGVKNPETRKGIKNKLDRILDFNTKIPDMDKTITEKFEGNFKVINDFLKKCAITSNGGIIDITLVQVIFIFFYTIIPTSVRNAKCELQKSSLDEDISNNSNNLFKQFYNNQIFFNFLSMVYMSVSRISNSRDLSFKNIFNNMKIIAPQYKDKGVIPDLLYINAGSGQAGGAIGDENDTTSNDMFKKISRIIPMQIFHFKTSPQTMVVKITIPNIIPPLCGISELTKDNLEQHIKGNPAIGDTSSSIRNESNIGSSRTELAAIDSSSPLSSEDQQSFINSNYQQTQAYIEKSLTDGSIYVQVGDCVQFILDGKLVKAIICFFKSGKYIYNLDSKMEYESNTNIISYWKSLKDKIQTAVNAQEREPLNLISVLNLRGFAFLPYEEESNGQLNIIYDCKSEITRLHNGYNPGIVSQADAFARLITSPISISTEFTVESIGSLQFNTASYMTLQKINTPDPMKPFAKHLQTLGNYDEGTITRSIQIYIQQQGLSSQCGKMVSPTDVNRHNLFKQKVMILNREFNNSGAFNMKVNQYNVYKSNIFIQTLLSENISSKDSIALFQVQYVPPVPELIYWLFTEFAYKDPNRAMIMVFQAFANDSTKPGGFKITSLKTLPGEETPGMNYFDSGQAGGGDDDDGGGGKGKGKKSKVVADSVTSSSASSSSASSSGYYADDNYEDDEGEEEEEEDDEGEEEEEDDENSENSENDASFVDDGNGDDAGATTGKDAGATTDKKDILISKYIRRLIDIVRKNGLWDSRYFDDLDSALRNAIMKYNSEIQDDIDLFSAETAKPANAEAAMKQHIETYNTAATAAAQVSESNKSTALDLAKTSSETLSRGAFNMLHLLKSRDGSNIDKQLGTCISGNNVVISCDGRTIRIDLDLATLLSTCTESVDQSALNDDIGKRGGSNDNGNNVKVKSGDGGGSNNKSSGGDKDKQRGSNGGGGGGDDDDGNGDNPAAAAAAAADAAAAAAADAQAKYTAYNTEYETFTKDPIYKYLDYDAEFNKFSEDSKVKELMSEV